MHYECTCVWVCMCVSALFILQTRIACSSLRSLLRRCRRSHAAFGWARLQVPICLMLRLPESHCRTDAVILAQICLPFVDARVPSPDCTRFRARVWALLRGLLIRDNCRRTFEFWLEKVRVFALHLLLPQRVIPMQIFLMWYAAIRPGPQICPCSIFIYFFFSSSAVLLTLCAVTWVDSS